MVKIKGEIRTIYKDGLPIEVLRIIDDEYNKLHLGWCEITQDE